MPVLFSQVENSSQNLTASAVDGDKRSLSNAQISSKEPSYRLGNMGHNIILCEALVHACGIHGLNLEKQEEGKKSDRKKYETSDSTETPLNVKK